MPHTFTGTELVGVTGTHYTDRKDPRFELAIETAERYQAAGLPLVAVDSSHGHENGSSWVSKELASHDVIVLSAAIGGIATQRQQGVAAAVAHGAEKVVSHEPEKTLMVEFAPEIAAALNEHDVLVVGRTQTAEDSLPPVQQRTEHLAGWLLETVHNFPADTLSGGRGFTAAGAEHLAAYPATEPGMNNWIYLYEVLMTARAAGKSVGGLSVELTHPETMVLQETGNPTFDRKRYDQFALQLDYLFRNKTVDRHAPLANRVLKLIDSYGDHMQNEAFAEQLDGLEADLRAYSYRPANREKS